MDTMTVLSNHWVQNLYRKVLVICPFCTRIQTILNKGGVLCDSGFFQKCLQNMKPTFAFVMSLPHRASLAKRMSFKRRANRASLFKRSALSAANEQPPPSINAASTT